MGRKISAYLELEADEDEFCEKHEVQLGNENLKFSSSKIISCFYEYPLKIILPSGVSNGNCQWCYPVTFGGGLVEGDNVAISVIVGSGCCFLMTTLSFPKVYCCENGLDSQQHLVYTVKGNSLLCVLPDPLVCFAKASYVQTQTFHLDADSSLVVLDWYTSGRHVREERWAFSKLKSVTSIFINDKLAFKEAQNMKNLPNLSIVKAMKSYNIFGTCFLIGLCLKSLSSSILLKLGKCDSYAQRRETDTLFAVSPLYQDDILCGCVLRFASESVEKAMRRIEQLLHPLYPVLGGNPFENK